MLKQNVRQRSIALSGDFEMQLFVYGTLKRGGPRHRFLTGQTFIAVARTRPLYRLYDLGDYPGLVESASGLSIEGELWDVDEACLKQLDQVEGCDLGLYRRGPVELAPPNDGLPTVAYLYQRRIDGVSDCGTHW
jgi:gamma-glutamylaminecyclotransferase